MRTKRRRKHVAHKCAGSLFSFFVRMLAMHFAGIGFAEWHAWGCGQRKRKESYGKCRRSLDAFTFVYGTFCSKAGISEIIRCSIQQPVRALTWSNGRSLYIVAIPRETVEEKALRAELTAAMASPAQALLLGDIPHSFSWC